MTDGWPMRMQCGRLTIEAHAPWCPCAIYRSTQGGDSTAVTFAKALRPDCRCAVAPPLPPGERRSAEVK